MAETSDLSGYDVIFVGFPVWWGREPSIIDTFLESNDLTGKTVIPFCTSGITGVEKAVAHIRGILGSGVTVEDGRRLGADGSEEEIRTWTELLKF
ncbi:MAG: hypothetical protein IKS37_04855 [Solobacterium sp.]|nr:hypothetical protein [Solobacterium sp.]